LREIRRPEVWGEINININININNVSSFDPMKECNVANIILNEKENMKI